MGRFRDRPTGDLLVFMIAGTVCFTVLASGLLVGLLSLFRPEVDVTLWVVRVTNVVNTMVGLLAGFLAGRSDRQWQQPPPSPPPPIDPMP